MKIYENHDISKYTTFKIGSEAKIVYVPESEEEFVELLKTFDRMPLIIGGGSNLLVSSNSVSQPVILTSALNEIKVKNNLLTVQCGVKTALVSKLMCEKGLSGMEFLSVIPASIGGVIKMNASAHSQSIKDIIKSAKVFDFEQKKILILSNEELELSYRTSILQKKPLILLDATFALEIKEPSLIKEKMNQNATYRKEKQPSLAEPNAGSIFRNPQGAIIGKLIEEAGLKGCVEGGAKISEKHGNFIVNFSKNATSLDVLKLMFKMYNSIKQNFGYEIKTEIIFVGNMTKEEKEIWEVVKSH